MNALAAIDATYNIFIERGIDLKNMNKAWQKGLSSFEGLPHRLKYVAEKNGVSYYDDSIATTPGSAIAAINSFDQPKILILGGSDKGADLTELVDMIAQSDSSDIRSVVLIGDESKNLEKQLQKRQYNNFINLGLNTDMNNIVKVSAELAKPGDIVILSPAHASFDTFKSYADRGEKFIKAVKEL